MHQITVLQNGLTVVTDYMPHVESAAINIWVKVGSRYEDQQLNGMSHFLEHMAFKGTDKRDSKQIAEEFDAIGGYLNAYTGRENTVYVAKVLKDDLPLAIEILADILQHSIFDPEELERERGVVLQEIAQTNDTHDDIIFDYFQAKAFPSQPLGRSILGTDDVIKSFNREHFQKYINKYYQASRMIISVAGNIKHEHIVELANIYFKDLKNENNFKVEPSSYQGGFSTTLREIEQVHLVVGFKGFSYNEPEYYIGNLISIILGGGMSSRLFQEIREKRGLAYSVHSYTSCYSDNGIFGIYAASEEAKINELIDVIAEEVVIKLIDSVTDKELSRARTQVKAGLLMGQESCSNRADDLGRNYSCYGKYITPAEIIARVESITRDDINRTLKKILTNATPTVAAIGKVDNMYDYDKICGKFKL